MEPITIEELEVLAKKVKDGSATEEENLQYLDIVKGLSGEFLDIVKSIPEKASL